MFRTLKQKLKRRLVQKFNRLHPLAGWAAGPALNANFNKIYGVGAKVTSVAEHVTLFNLAAQSQGNVVEVGLLHLHVLDHHGLGFCRRFGSKTFCH